MVMIWGAVLWVFEGCSGTGVGTRLWGVQGGWDRPGHAHLAGAAPG